MKKFILIFLFFYNISHSQSAWTWFVSTPTTNNYNCVKFIDNYTGFISGENGTLLRTSNGGTNWNFIENNTNRLFTCVFPVNASAVYALTATPSTGQGSQLYKSTNGGTNWFIQQYFSSINLRAIYFLNSNTGYISGDGGIISYTSDGGANWIDRSYGGGISLQSIQFINNQTGFVSTGDQSGTGNLLKTTNGGINWISLLCEDSYFTSFYFKDANTGIICGGKHPSVPYPPYYYYQEKIFRTSNGGLTWDTTLFSRGGIFRTLSAYNNNAFVFGEASSRRSTDFGITWLNFGFICNPTPRYSYWADTSNIYIVGDYGKIIKIIDSWWIANLNQSLTSLPISSIYFINTNTGFIVTPTDDFYQYSFIYKTTNAGNNWFHCYEGYEQTFKNVMFKNNYGIANGIRELLLTSNGGTNWNYYWYPTTFDINKSCILPNTKAIAVGDSNLIVQSYNFGSWSQYPISGVGHLIDITFPDENTGYIISNNNKYLKSTNSGNSWNIQTLPENNIQSIYFLNSNTGFINTVDKLFKTTNGGMNWITVMYNQILWLSKLFFIDTLKGFALGNESTSYYNFFCTTNGGINWNPILLHYSGLHTGVPLCLHFANSLTGYVTGENGTIFRTTNGGTIWVNNIESKIPDNFSLSQNYPNPFNPTTNIKYQIKSKGLVTFKIYDILGKEIATLVNEKQSPGTYEVSWDGSAYPSGVYFYKLIAGNFSETKKMLLIK